MNLHTVNLLGFVEKIGFGETYLFHSENSADQLLFLNERYVDKVTEIILDNRSDKIKIEDVTLKIQATRETVIFIWPSAGGGEETTFNTLEFLKLFNPSAVRDFVLQN